MIDLSLIERSLKSSLKVGVVMTLLAPFMGRLRFPGNIWLQLLRIFLITAVSFFVVSLLVEIAFQAWKNWKAKRR